MENFISRWHREKAQAIEQARVFDVEERDGCLRFTKRLPPIMKRSKPTLLLASLLIVGGGIGGIIGLASSGSQLNWFNAVFPILIGLWIIIAPLSEIKRAERGEIWVFDRDNQQVKYNNLVVMSLKSLEKVKMQRVSTDDNPDYFQLWIISKEGQHELLDQDGLAHEYLEVGRRISTFALIPFMQGF